MFHMNLSASSSRHQSSGYRAKRQRIKKGRTRENCVPAYPGRLSKPVPSTTPATALSLLHSELRTSTYVALISSHSTSSSTFLDPIAPSFPSLRSPHPPPLQFTPCSNRRCASHYVCPYSTPSPRPKIQTPSLSKIIEAPSFSMFL